MYLVCSGTHQTIDCHRCCHDLNECHHTEKVHQRMSTDIFFVEADDSAILANASTFSVCLGVIFAEFSDANAC